MNSKLVHIAGMALLASLALAAVALGFGHLKPARHLQIFGGDNFPVAIADFNGDGRNDVAVGSEKDDIVSVLYGKRGGFRPARQFPAGDYPFSIATGNFAGDSRPDMAVVAESDDAIALLRSKPGGFAAPVLFDTGSPMLPDDPQAVAAGRLNGDGRPDLAVANGDNGTLGILIGRTGGSFRPAVTYSTGGVSTSPVDVTTGDFNRDGKTDVAVLNSQLPGGGDGAQVALFLGRGDGSFRPAVRSNVGAKGPYGFVKGRFDPGRTLDLVVSDCNGANKLFLLRGKNNGRFRHSVGYPTVFGSCGYDPAAVDLNRDGRLDVVNVSEANGKVSISLQKATGGFGPPHSKPAVEVAYSVAAGRLNGDRLPDLVVPDYENPDATILISRP